MPFLRPLKVLFSTATLPTKDGLARQGTSKKFALADHRHSGMDVEQVLWLLSGANMNITTDQAISKVAAWAAFPFTTCLITRIMVTGLTGNSSAAVGGIYSGAGKTGNVILSASQAYSAVTGVGKRQNVLDSGGGILLDLQTSLNPIFALTTTAGVAATADVRIIGIPLT